MTALKNIQPKPIRWEIHVLIWLAYTAIWIFILNPNGNINIHTVIGHLIFNLSHILICYFNVFVLMPRFFNEKKSWLYLPLVIVSLFAVVVFHSYSMYAYLHYICQCGGEYYLDLKKSGSTLIGSNSSVLFVTTIIHLYRQRRALQEHQQELEKTQLRTELKYLKSQLNPHFLFNALNSIYFLIKKNPDEAADALAGFSDLLRHQLYQKEGEKIDLAEEIENLKKYIQLAALRKSKDLKISIDLPDDIENIKITPLLLLPLVENAFKHTGNKEGFIEVKAILNEENLDFVVRNNFEHYTPEPTQVKEEGGIGLVNIRRRLDLLYPERHKLTIKEEETIFTANLNIQL